MLLYVYVSMDPRGLIQINDDDDNDDTSSTSHPNLGRSKNAAIELLPSQSRDSFNLTIT